MLKSVQDIVCFEGGFNSAFIAFIINPNKYFRDLLLSPKF